MSTVTVAVLMLVLALWACCAPAQGEPPAEYVSDILGERLLFHTQGFGHLGLDTACRVEGRTPSPLRVGETVYEKGLGHHANGEILLMLEGKYLTFEAEVGILWQKGDTGTVVFEVYVDGEQRFDSGVVKERDAPKPLRVSVEGAQLLRLVATDAGDGITCDCANWLNARLIPNPNPPAASVAPPVDVAQFATVATWDPQRTEGTRAGRVQEFPAEDVFLHTELWPNAEGAYGVPVNEEGAGCIGLQWAERRFVREVGLEFAGEPPPTEGVEVQAWSGESWWQGEWVALEGTLDAEGDRWTFGSRWPGDSFTHPRNTQKVRWILPNCVEAVLARRPSAHTRAVWDTTTFIVEAENAEPGESGQIEVYNGELVSDDGGVTLEPVAWDMSDAIELTLRYSRPMPVKSDRTVLRFSLPWRPDRSAIHFAVAIEDVLENDAVYVPDAGVFVALKAAGLALAEHKRAIEGRETVLDMVRRSPDQTFDQALAKVHRPVQNNGPMLLSLACDNRKFQVNRDGAIQFSLDPDVAHRGAINYPVELRPRFGSGGNAGLERHPYGGWLPVPVITVEEDDIRYRQRTFVAPYPGVSPGASVCVVELTVENVSEKAAGASLSIAVAADRREGVAAELSSVPQGVVAKSGERLLTFIATGEADGLSVEAGAGEVTFSGTLEPGAPARVFAYIPSWAMAPDDYATLRGGAGLLAGAEAYWHRILARSTQIDIPDPLLADVIRASQVHCLMAARSEADGERIAPWIGSDRYGPLESEAHSIVLGMDLLGHNEFARRSLDFFVERYNDKGYLTTGYTTMGTGWHLWTLAEHARLTGDRSWLRKVAPEVARVCRWIARQRIKTKRVRPNGEPKPAYGLMPPGVVADWGMYANRFFGEAQFCAGLMRAAKALAEIDHPGAEDLRREAGDYRADILLAYRWAQQRTPVRPLRNGTWIPGCPAMVQCFGKVGEFFPGEDWGRTWAGDVEIGPQHLIVLGVMEADWADAEWMTEFFEDYWCLHDGMGEYPAEESEADPLNLGGFSKVQPYYARMTDVYAVRDEVKPFIRAYLNAIPSLLNLENLSMWEHFHNVGGWNKTHETGWLLQQTRTMLVTEREDELWLAPFVPNHWLKDGLEVGIRNAPTHFGEVSYRLRSSVSEGYIEARIEPPARRAPETIVIRLRHPEGKRMRKVTVNGEAHEDFDAEREWVRVKMGGKAVTLRAEY